jgi:hypothetical protein
LNRHTAAMICQQYPHFPPRYLRTVILSPYMQRRWEGVHTKSTYSASLASNTIAVVVEAVGIRPGDVDRPVGICGSVTAAARAVVVSCWGQAW